jgi:hypothetical protein
MLNLKFFLTEAVSDESKLTHLEHAEDHVINAGDKGFAHAYHNLQDTHDTLKGKKNKTSITTKYDGSPSIVWGHHPSTGKFFVGTKSVFNKDPKINHSEEDIDRNHGHAPGLAEKLKHALKHLPKITPKGKIYQGDLMHSGVKSKSNPSGDVEMKDNKLHFKPNTITYSTHHESEEGQKIKHSKLGVVPHTEYKGTSLTNMKAHYNADTSQLKEHPDVHVVHPTVDHKKVKYTPEQQKEFDSHMHAATNAFNNAHKDFHSAIEPHSEHLKTYINKTVKDQSTPSVAGYKAHMAEKAQKEMDKVKTEKSKAQKQKLLHSQHGHVDSNQEHFQSALNMHHHLQKAKNVLVGALSTHQKFDHHIAGIKTKPEGFVAVRSNRPTKLVDRGDFSRANFLARER